MFLIPTYVGPSAIHGYGVFTAVPIAANTVIWQFVEGVDLRLSEGDLLAVPPQIRAPLRSYCYREESGAYVLCGDNAKFMNHSVRPSCDDDGVATVVPRDLPVGAELTCDYRAFDYDTINGRGEWFTATAAR
ncbi:MAG: SET domain-containing protein [Gemmatimonadetes bacterium]|nr:SET domain-containing protein [Gemmatimonadota bacterium]